MPFGKSDNSRMDVGLLRIRARAPIDLYGGQCPGERIGTIHFATARSAPEVCPGTRRAYGCCLGLGAKLAARDRRFHLEGTGRCQPRFVTLTPFAPWNHGVWQIDRFWALLDAIRAVPERLGSPSRSSLTFHDSLHRMVASGTGWGACRPPDEARECVHRV
jgi:hypothetical protein